MRVTGCNIDVEIAPKYNQEYFNRWDFKSHEISLPQSDHCPDEPIIDQFDRKDLLLTCSSSTG